MKAIRFLALWLAAALVPAWAQNADGTCTAAPCYEYTFGTVTNPNQLQEPWLKSYVAACDRQRALYDAWNPTAAPMTYTGCTASGGTVTFKAKAGYPYAPTQWTQSMARRLRPPDDRCAEKAGQVVKRNLTIGWQSGLFDNGAIEYKPDGTKAPAGYYGPRPSDGPVCSDGCRMDLGGIQNVWVSEAPSPNGLYRISGDYQMTYAGAQCTATSEDDAKASPAAPTPETDCTPGVVNGKKVCVPNSWSDRNTTPAQGGKNATRGNPAAGTDNPTPASIPETGNGGNSGGPKQSTDGGVRTPSGVVTGPPGTPAPSGTIEKPPEGEEQAECGAPGQPKCAIDEAGTPSGEGALGEGDGSAASTEAGFLSEIAKAQQLQAPQWTWTFQLPSGCTPLVMEAFTMTIDVCQWQPMVHGLMGIMWIMAAVFLCVRMVFTTVNKG